MPHMRTLLREIYISRQVVGFSDAVADLGTHRVCGTETVYSRQMVYNVLHGRSLSRKLLFRIVERRPDLLDLSFVSEKTREAARKIGWRPHMGMPRRRDFVGELALSQGSGNCAEIFAMQAEEAKDEVKACD